MDLAKLQTLENKNMYTTEKITNLLMS